MSAEVSSPAESVLSVRDLTVRFATRRGVATVVDDVSWEVAAGETLAIVGESGSGKSVSALAVMGLLPTPPARVQGQVWLEGSDLLQASPQERRRTRGRRLGMVFQDPMTSLNPFLTIGKQVSEGVEHHLGLHGSELRDRAVELLGLVGIPAPADRLDEHPHQFSGGMRQRVMIAIALACEPQVLIADEATTALDVTTQAQIIELLGRLQEDMGMAVVWITHDLGVVAGIADRVSVMYAGQVVEEAPVDALYADPRHPYTQGLLGALPVIGGHGRELATISGLPPDPLQMPPGCRFWPRCTRRLDARCEHEPPTMWEVGPGHRVRTFYDTAREGSR
ncbi:MAG: Oligopeptide transport ATP-binding protein OppD [uncultured Nocardioidaceae bacterium]|uniref:Oligopeptide transport ATP-binding protein OppD n=1 Tax=uncultured Nocardioidaceae bacterium TaxID=253824 RepID=A0A6J4MC81_9ACTN|nr:MAG: Oligopeptide transport ATP-binding protein OppD [uncultured Nocardioidaceae bacterium]